MKPGIISSYFGMLDPYEMAKTFVECGYHQADIAEVHFKRFYDEMDVHEYRRFIDDLGFSTPQGHLVFMNEGNITSIDNTYAIERLKKNLDVFLELGVKAAVLHYSNFGTDWVPWEDWFDVRVDALNQLTEYVKGTDLVICLENLSRLYDFDAGHLLRLCKAVDNKDNIGICLDTGHLHISKQGNQYDFIMQAGAYLKAMHVHENHSEHDGLIGLPCDEHLPPFSCGGVNFENVKRGVKEVNYQGLFSYEINPPIPLEVKKIQAKYLLEVYNQYFAF